MTDNFSNRVVATLKDLRSSIPAGTFYSADPPESPTVGTLWVESDNDVPSISIYKRWSKVLTEPQSIFSGLDNGIFLEYTPKLESVYLNGILLLSGIDYTATDGLSISLESAAQEGDVLEVISPNTFNIANLYDKQEVDILLSNKAETDSPSFTGVPSAPTAETGTNTTQIATTSFVRTEVANLVDSAPSTLDTLNELAAALGNDPNFATTITNSIASKQKLIPLQSSAPTSPLLGDLWVDNTDAEKPILKSYNGSSWVEVGSTVEADSDQIILSTRMFA
jgi:hypothetical protein